MIGHPSSPSHWWGKSLMKEASQILGTNDSILRQLMPPHPSHVEGPGSPRCLGLLTYPNPHPSSLTIPCNKRIKTTPNMVRGQTSSTCLVRSGNFARSASPLKPVRHSFWCPGHLYLTAMSLNMKAKFYLESLIILLRST